jgi:hypothetical protein
MRFSTDCPSNASTLASCYDHEESCCIGKSVHGRVIVLAT